MTIWYNTEASSNDVTNLIQSLLAEITTKADLAKVMWNIRYHTRPVEAPQVAASAMPDTKY